MWELILSVLFVTVVFYLTRKYFIDKQVYKHVTALDTMNNPVAPDDMLNITYIDGDGSVTIRDISDCKVISNGTINAYCHMRNDRRDFKISSILEAALANTGEIIVNIWRHFDVAKDDSGRERVISAVSHILPEIFVLKYFHMQARGHFGKRYRTKIVDYILANSSLDATRREEIEEWLVKLWVGSIYNQKDPIHMAAKCRISGTRIEICREGAHRIAAGSGRKPVSQDLLDYIYSDFPTGPSLPLERHAEGAEKIGITIQ